MKGRDCESEFLGLWAAGRIEVPCWAFMPRLMGPDSAEYTEGQQGSTLSFLFTQSTVLCVRAVIDWQPVRGGDLPFAQCMVGKSLVLGKVPGPDEQRKLNEWMKNTSKMSHSLDIKQTGTTYFNIAGKIVKIEMIFNRCQIFRKYTEIQKLSSYSAVHFFT